MNFISTWRDWIIALKNTPTAGGKELRVFGALDDMAGNGERFAAGAVFITVPAVASAVDVGAAVADQSPQGFAGSVNVGRGDLLVAEEALGEDAVAPMPGEDSHGAECDGKYSE